MVAALAGKVVVAIAGLLTVAIMTRHLGAADYGVIKTAQTFVLFAGALAHCGLHYIMLRDVALHEQRADHIAGSALAARLTLAVILLAASCALALLTSWNTTVLIAIAIAAVGMAAYQGNEVVTAILQWRLSQGRAMLAEVAGTVAALAGVALTAWWGLGVLTMTAVSSAGLIITFACAWYLASRITPVRLHFDRQEWGRLLRDGMPIGASFYLLIISLRSDTLLLALLKPAADVGFYGVASKIYEVSLQLPLIFGGLLMPIFSRAVSDPPVFREQVAQSLHVMIIVGGGLALALGFFSGDIVLLLAGSGFLPAAAAVQITGASVALAGYSLMLRHAAMAQQRQKKLLGADLLITASALTAYFIFIPRFSYIGAALGTFTTEVVSIICLHVVVGRLMGRFPGSERAWRALLAVALAAGAIWMLRQAGLPVLVVAASSAFVYGGLLLLTGALNMGMLRNLLASGQARM
jgi:O-antigen/teichoic acid export membrane protein